MLVILRFEVNNTNGNVGVVGGSICLTSCFILAAAEGSVNGGGRSLGPLTVGDIRVLSDVADAVVDPGAADSVPVGVVVVDEFEVLQRNTSMHK